MNLSGISSSSSFGKLLRLPLSLIPTNAVLPVMQGPMRGMKWISGSSTHGCWLGSYEYEEQRLFSAAINPQSTVWDIGANVGLYTLLASRKAARVIAVEPLPDNIGYLERHLQLNKLRNVEIVCRSCGSRMRPAIVLRWRKSFCRASGSRVAEGRCGHTRLSVCEIWSAGCD